ncbi:MAG: hypothetical protein EBR30_08100 [Cytophagia bacterium]|nr:hypothetical protein [Cytophagia bacterium]
MNYNDQLPSICFVANFHKTVLFHKLATELSTYANVFWIVSKKDQCKFLVDTYGADRVLNINRSNIQKVQPIVDDFRLHELVYGDRVFKYEFENGLKFLQNIQYPLYDFFRSNRIRFIFGEIAWAHEVLIQRIAKKRVELNCTYFQFNVIRMPSRRFAFFRGETEFDMVEFEGAPNAEQIIKLEKPAYLKINDKIVSDSISISGRLKRLKRFLTGENIEKNDPNVIVNLLTRFKIAVTEEVNRSSYRLLSTTSFEEIKKENYIFYGFQKQPESSLDVSGRYYEDQFAILTNLWRLLPAGWKLVAKEHTNAIGDRSFSFYKKLLKYPDFILAHEKIDSKLLIENSKLVVTVNGTIGYEAGLMKKPAITLAPVFFNKINFCRFVPFDTLMLYESLKTIVEELESQKDNRLEFTNYVMKNSFDGYISDYVTDPTVMEEGNIKQLSHAFLKLLNTY